MYIVNFNPQKLFIDWMAGGKKEKKIKMPNPTPLPAAPSAPIAQVPIVDLTPMVPAPVDIIPPTNVLPVEIPAPLPLILEPIPVGTVVDQATLGSVSIYQRIASKITLRNLPYIIVVAAAVAFVVYYIWKTWKASKSTKPPEEKVVVLEKPENVEETSVARELALQVEEVSRNMGKGELKPASPLWDYVAPAALGLSACAASFIIAAFFSDKKLTPDNEGIRVTQEGSPDPVMPLSSEQRSDSVRTQPSPSLLNHGTGCELLKNGSRSGSRPAGNGSLLDLAEMRRSLDAIELETPRDESGGQLGALPLHGSRSGSRTAGNGSLLDLAEMRRSLDAIELETPRDESGGQLVALPLHGSRSGSRAAGNGSLLDLAEMRRSLDGIESQTQSNGRAIQLSALPLSGSNKEKSSAARNGSRSGSRAAGNVFPVDDGVAERIKRLLERVVSERQSNGSARQLSALPLHGSRTGSPAPGNGSLVDDGEAEIIRELSRPANATRELSVPSVLGPATVFDEFSVRSSSQTRGFRGNHSGLEGFGTLPGSSPSPIRPNGLVDEAKAVLYGLRLSLPNSRGPSSSI